MYEDNHANVSKEGENDFCTRKAGEYCHLDNRKTCSNCPLDIPRPVNLTEDKFCGVFVMMKYVDKMVGPTSSSCQYKIREGRCKCDQDAKVMKETKMLKSMKVK